MSRPTWDQTFMQMAAIIAQRGTCPRAQVGALVVSPTNQVVSVGYNGSPKNQPHCTEAGCIILPNGGCGRAVHAEINALMQAGDRALGSTVYVTLSPCYACAAAIANAGVLRVVYLTPYRKVDGIPDPVEFLIQCGTLVEPFYVKEGSDAFLVPNR